MSKDGYETMGGPAQTGCEIFREEIVKLKWRVLIFACVLTFGSYYIYDFPGSIGTGKTNTIQSRFIEKGKDYTQEMNQALYSVYSWPNTVLALFGGILIDKFLGLRKAMSLFVLLVFLGSMVFFFGVLSRQYGLLIFGRVVFGLGGESLSVAQSAFVARWFKDGRGMALAFGITISFARVGSSFNFLFSPQIATNHGVVTSAMFGMFACLLSAFSCACLVAMDIYGTKKGLVPAENKDVGEPFKFSQIKNMPVLFWLASGMCVTVYCAVFPLIGVAKNYFEVKYDIEGDEASSYVSVYQFVCAGGSPLTGGMVDVVGRFSIWMMVAGAGFTLIHVLFLVAKIPPWAMMAMMGVVYSVLVSSLWPAVPYVVQTDLVGLAYGIMTAMQNSGLAIWPLVAGAILTEYTPPQPYQGEWCDKWNNDLGNVTWFMLNHSLPPGNLSHCCNNSPCDAELPHMEGYVWTEVFFMCTAGVGFLIAATLFVVDRRQGGVLSSNPTRREEIKQERLRLTADLN